ncbi:Taxilin family [Globomyces pollinis-pini]|nr:Taxilin family [Globomyces pollinis-pini]
MKLKSVADEISIMTDILKENMSDAPEILIRKYMDLFQDFKKTDIKLQKYKSLSQEAVVEIDNLNSELTKSTHQKQTLESISRELQRKFRTAQEENKNYIKAKDEVVHDIQNKFFAQRLEMKDILESKNRQLMKSQDDTNILKAKFKSFLEEYHIREQHFMAVNKTKDKEYALCQAKRDLFLEQAKEAELKYEKVNNQLNTFVKTEVDLRKQLSVYVEKFKQVEETLNKSNELFLNFRKEMEIMTKKTMRLESEKEMVKSNNIHLTQINEDLSNKIESLQHSFDVSELRVKKLDSICRALQTERIKIVGDINFN